MLQADVGVPVQDASLRPSLADIDEQLAQLAAEQGALNADLAEQRQQDQALLQQMLPPQVPHLAPVPPC